MILAETLESLTSYSPQFLTRAVLNAGIPAPLYIKCRFLGITNGGQFCYSVTDQGGSRGKVFLTYDHAEDKVTADIG
jgi:hypothetical protein